ncbi:hypothetical protein FS842_010852 [Serendipita sp. 407]|nr:hypothetical protein FS842_010852 [Serendipita sp. 407]
MPDTHSHLICIPWTLRQPAHSTGSSSSESSESATATATATTTARCLAHQTQQPPTANCQLQPSSPKRSKWLPIGTLSKAADGIIVPPNPHTRSSRVLSQIISNFFGSRFPPFRKW